jgi:hypothetical protein
MSLIAIQINIGGVEMNGNDSLEELIKRQQEEIAKLNANTNEEDNKNAIRRNHHVYYKMDDDASYSEKEKNYLEQIEDELAEEMIKAGEYYIKDGKVEAPIKMGLCHIVWGCKKRLLKEIFDFDWQTPQEKHPDCCYD